MFPLNVIMYQMYLSLNTVPLTFSANALNKIIQCVGFSVSEVQTYLHQKSWCHHGLTVSVKLANNRVKSITKSEYFHLKEIVQYFGKYSHSLIHDS